METPGSPRSFRVEAVLFDFDGTLTKAAGIDFAGLRNELGAPPGTYALEFIRSLEGEGRRRAEQILERFEDEGAGRAVPNEGAEDAVLRLRELGLPLGIVTRNRLAAVERSLGRFERLSLDEFDVVVTRDDPVRFKPQPDSVLYAASHLGVAPERVMFVGDFVVDVEAGYRAGAITVYLPEPDEDEALEHEPDFRIDGLHELEPIVRLGLPLSKGKLPNEYLAQHLGGLAAADGAVLVGAGVGEDIAALDVSGDEVIVAHPDPITLATADLGRYSVLVNANDIATSGGDPLWFLTTVLLPPGTTPSEALRLLGEIGESCAAAGIALVGGHTEITDAVTRPTVAGTMLGTVARADLREKAGVSEGDRVVLTERIAVEGTALLAQELGERLRSLGMTEADLGACRALAERLSVLDAARVARRFEGVTAMHDVTEGGIATAVRELASASGHSLVVDIDRIPVFPETARVCELLGADPFGLIGSGSLLVCCRPDEADALVEALAEAGVEAAEVGKVSASGGAVTAQANGRPSKWPSFAVDEAARLLG